MKKSSITINRERRNEEAQKRQAQYNALTTEQKLARLDSRPGEAKRERARLGKDQ